MSFCDLDNVLECCSTLALAQAMVVPMEVPAGPCSSSILFPSLTSAFDGSLCAQVARPVAAMKDHITTVTENNNATPSSPEGEKDDDVYDDNVPLRYRGTIHDKKDMNMLGKRQVLRVRRSLSCLSDPF